MPISAAWDRLHDELGAVSPEELALDWAVPLAARTTLKIGGPAHAVAVCKRQGGVVAALAAARAAELPWLVLGQGANVLVPDAGLEALVIRLDDELAGMKREGTTVTAGGGVSLVRLVRESLAAGLAGLECLGGIPSTLGGALAMNAGAYGQELLDVLAWADVVEPDGTVRRLERREIEGGYRWSVLGRGRIVTRAELRLRADDPAALRERAAQARRRRLAALPPEPSAGSVFCNPAGDYAGRLLELAGCKGLRRGAAVVSERHANVIVNLGGARACEVRELLAEMARRVRERFAVSLELELKVLAVDGSVILDPEAPLTSAV
jgi:UDP-N-acetylmuramate dehydrogenase